MAADPLVEAYARHHYAYNDISPKRQHQQQRVLAAFLASLPCPVNQVEGRHLRDYLSARLESGLAKSTVRKEMNMIRPFLGWLHSERIIGAEAILSIRDVRAPRGANMHEPRPYTRHQQRMFWAELNVAYPWAKGTNTREHGETYADRWREGRSKWARVQPYARRLQMEAIVSLMIYGGVRKDEVYRLTLEHLSADNEYVVVVGARKNAAGEPVLRAVPWIVPQMRQAVSDWLEFRAEIEPEHDRPWLTLRPERYALNPMRPRAWDEILLFGRRWEMHRLRHTAATEMLRGGWKLEHVQKILGHSNIAQTLRYARIDEADLLRANSKHEIGLAAVADELRDPTLEAA